ncbi:hypothetical protein BROUX41_000148 [Berkeleyomyces rouxiae]|uniref:uncharacterized protein n=1 Tax=Berkeleyomyces rouxiae TaxID=2035830 RepID=UPI003B7F828C
MPTIPAHLRVHVPAPKPTHARKLTLGMLAAPNSRYRVSSLYPDDDQDEAAAGRGEPVSPLSPLLSQLGEAAARARARGGRSPTETPLTPVSAVSGSWRAKRKTIREAVSGWWDLNLLNREAVAQKRKTHMRGWI